MPGSLGNILYAAPGRLHHLVMGAGTLIDKAVAENNRTIIGKLGSLKAAQLAKTAMLWNKTFRHVNIAPCRGYTTSCSTMASER